MNNRQVSAEFKLHLDRAIAQATTSERTSPSRLFYLRPSSFPYCGLRYFLSFGERYRQHTHYEFTFSFYTRIGSLVHDLLQQATSRFGRIVGDYHCKKCNTWHRFTTESKCKKCGSEAEHHELEFTYRNTVLGHSDTLYRFKPELGLKSQHAIWDYKTAGVRAIWAGADKLPYKGNIAQIEAYIPLAKAQYGVTVQHWSLIYIARDNPNTRYIHTQTLTEEDQAKVQAKLDKAVDIHRHVLTLTSLDDALDLNRTKLCRSRDHYEKEVRGEYEGCPFQAECFKKDERKEMIVTVYKDYKKSGLLPLINKAPADIRKGMKL